MPSHLRGQVAFALAGMYVGDPAEGARFFQPLKDLAPTLDLIQPMPYTTFQAILDPTAPKGYRSYWRGEYVKRLSDDAIEAFIRQGPGFVAASKPFSQVIMFRIGQGVSAVADDATAFSHRDPDYLFHPISMWVRPEDDQRLISANRAFCESMRPFTTGGAYLNFTPENAVATHRDSMRGGRCTVQIVRGAERWSGVQEGLGGTSADPVLGRNRESLSESQPGIGRSVARGGRLAPADSRERGLISRARRGFMSVRLTHEEDARADRSPRRDERAG